jgi:serine/threonine protein kinase
MMMEKIGPSVASVMKGVIKKFGTSIATLKFANRIFIESVHLLKRLHQYGIVHGDIHGGNIAFRDPQLLVDDFLASGDSDIPPLTILDYGLSLFFPLGIGAPEKVHPSIYQDLNPLFLSHYQQKNFRTGMRDDLIRLFELFSQWITPNNELRKFLDRNRIDDSGNSIIFIKENVDFFSEKLRKTSLI